MGFFRPAAGEKNLKIGIFCLLPPPLVFGSKITRGGGKRQTYPLIAFDWWYFRSDSLTGEKVTGENNVRVFLSKKNLNGPVNDLAL